MHDFGAGGKKKRNKLVVLLSTIQLQGANTALYFVILLQHHFPLHSSQSLSLLLLLLLDSNFLDHKLQLYVSPVYLFYTASRFTTGMIIELLITN